MKKCHKLQNQVLIIEELYKAMCVCVYLQYLHVREIAMSVQIDMIHLTNIGYQRKKLNACTVNYLRVRVLSCITNWCFTIYT